MPAAALRYALVPACVVLAVLVHLSPVGSLFPIAGLFVFAVLGAAWFGGPGPGFLTAALSAVTIPLFVVSYPLLWGFLDLPRFITFAIEGLAVGWWSLRRRGVQAALRESERRYELTINASDEGFWDWIPAGDKLFLSPRFLELFGFPPATTFAGRAAMFEALAMAPEDRAALDHTVAEHFAGKTARLDFEFRILVGGEVRWINARALATRDSTGEVVRWNGAVSDATARKHAEEALRNSEQRYALAMEAAGDGHTDWDLVSGEFYISPRLLEILGHPPDASFADRADWVRRFPFHPEDRPKWEAAVVAHLAGRESHFKMEVRIVVRGEVRWTAFHFLATRDAAGKPIRWTGSIGDITEQKRVEGALRASEERYSLAMEAAEEGYVDSDVETDEFVTSERLNEIFGIPRGTRFVDRSSFLKYFRFYGNDAKTYGDMIRATGTPGGPDRYAFEFRIVLQSGEVRWLWTRGKVTRDAEGRARRRVGVVADITARKVAEEALRTSEDRFSRAVAGSYDGVWDIDFVAGSVYFSARTRDLCGLPAGPEVVPLEGWFEALPLHPDDRPKRFAAVQAHLSGKAPVYEVEVRLRQSDGVYRWRHIHGKCVRDPDGKPLRMAGSISDVDARRRAEEALRESEERYERVVAATEAGFWDWDVLHDKYYVSPRLLEMAGLPRDTVIAGRADFQARVPIHPDDLGGWQKDMRALFENGGTHLSTELRVVLDTGTHWYRLDGMCFRDAAGRVARWTGSAIDITPRKLAEEALRASEERYSLAMEGAQEGHFDVDADTGDFFASARVNEIYGFPSGTRFTKRAEYLAQLRLHPDDVEKYHAAVAEVMAKDGPSRFEFEYRIVRPSGDIRWIRTRGKVTRDAGGRPRRRTGTVADVTQAKLADEALRESEKRYELAMAASESGYWDWDIPGGRYFVSPRAYEMGGYESGTTWAHRDDFRARINMHPEDFAKWEAAREELFAGTGERLAMEVRYIVRGETRWHMLNAICRRDDAGKVVRWTGSATDVTARKLAEEALRESEARKSAMFEAALDCIVSIDHEGRVVEFNPAAERTFGYGRAEALGKELAELIVPPRLRAQHRQGLARYLKGGEARVLGRRTEIAAVRADGSEFLVELSVTRIATEGAPLFTAYLRDITERKRAEEKLRESEARFRVLTELSSDWYWRQDEQMRFAYMANHATVLGGYTDDTSLGKTWWELEGLAPLSTSWAEHQAVLAARQPFRDLELRRVMPDGAIHYLSIAGAPTFDELGRFKGYQGVGRDITERKRIEEQLRSRQEMLGLAQKSAQAIAFEWRIGANGSGRNRWSPELAALHGITPEAYDGSLRRWKQLIHPEDWPAVREAIKHARRTGDIAAEYRVVHPDGAVYWLHARGRLLFDHEGRAARMVGFMHDVTQRRHAEEALRLSEERYALAVASADEGIFDWDLLSDRVYVSQRARELFALPVGELWQPRREWRRILNYHPDDIELQRNSIKALIAGETSTYDVEFRVIFPDESVRWFRQRAIALRDATGKAYRMVGSVGDITDRKRAQEELQRLERQLRQAQRLEAMGTLAGGIAHDFNNILGAILGYGEMALRGAPKGSRLARDVDSIIVAGERGRALVDRVLAFSRSAVGERVPVHVEAVVREALDLVAASLPSSVTVHPKLRAGPAAVLGDATQVHQVVTNLATNAIQAMPAGGTLLVELAIERIETARAVTIGALACGEYVALTVADTGAGIAPEIIDRIFDPFFTTKEVGTGTGLGLSLVHGITTDLGGAIDVASAPGAGSTFKVYLPRSGDAAEPGDECESALPRGEGQRVLIVDDEEPLVQLATRALQDLGYVPIGFTSSTAALEAFRATPERFDALVTDERMPGMSGSALIRQVRGIRDRMPIVLMSGYVGSSVSRRARNAGAEEVLKKPLSARDLATSLARVLRL